MVGTAVVVVGGGGAFVVLVGGGGGGTVVVVVGGGLDQVLVQVYVVTQLGGGALGAPAGGSCLATAPAGLFGAARGVVRTGPPDPSLFELLSLLVSAFGAELAAGAGAPGAGAPGAAGVLGVEVPASRVKNIGNVLLKANVSFAYFGDQFDRYLQDPYLKNPEDLYC
ncbi:MAG: hypothetical protein WB735_18375, partial [Pseudonocardiaceae bacterium]